MAVDNDKYKQAYLRNAEDIRALVPIVETELETFTAQKVTLQSNNDFNYDSTESNVFIGENWTFNINRTSSILTDQYFTGTNQAQQVQLTAIAVGNEFNADIYKDLEEKETLSSGTYTSRKIAQIDNEIALAQSIIDKKTAEKTDLETNGASWAQQPDYTSYLNEVNNNIAEPATQGQGQGNGGNGGNC